MASWKFFALVLVLLAVGATAGHRPMLIFKGGSHFGSGGHGALAALLAAGAIAKLFHGHGLSAGGFSGGARSAPRAYPREIHQFYYPAPMMYGHPEWM